MAFGTSGAVSIKIRIFLCFALLAISSSAISDKILSVRKVAKTTWVKVESEHFLIYTDVKPENAGQFAVELEEFRYFIGSVLGLELLEGLPKAKFLLIQNDKTFRSLFGNPLWAGIFASRYRGAYSVSKVGKFRDGKMRSSFERSAVLHELVHYLVSTSTARKQYPTWYSEGMAEYLSTFSIDAESITFGDVKHFTGRFHSMRKSRGRGYDSVDVESLFKAKSLLTGGDSDNGILSFYGRSFVVVHYLASNSANAKSLSVYLAALDKGLSVDNAFRLAFDKTYLELDAEINEYIDQRFLSGVKVPRNSGSFEFPSTTPEVTPSKGEDVSAEILDIALQFITSDSREKARKKLIAALTKHFPNSQKMDLLKAEYLMKKSNPETLALVEKYIQQNPGSDRAYSLRGEIFSSYSLEERHLGNPKWRDTIKLARSDYRKALKINHLNGVAYHELGQSYFYENIENKNFQEGVISEESSRFFVEKAESYLVEANLRMLNDDFVGAISPMRRYFQLSDGIWEMSYGGFILDALQLNEVPTLSIDLLTKDSIRYTDKSSFKGDLTNKLPNGLGELTRPNGVTYSGSWLNGLPHGNGILHTVNGIVYEGEFDMGAVSGKGKLTYPPSEDAKYLSYEGDFYNFYEHGYGVETSVNHVVYAGFWDRGHYHGEGVQTFPGGKKFETDWVWGRARIILEDKTIFRGYLDDEGNPKGYGYCSPEEEHEFSNCHFKEGKLIWKNKPS